jgi:hypothetical protein
MRGVTSIFVQSLAADPDQFAGGREHDCGGESVLAE